MNGFEELKNILTSSMEIQSVEFAQLVWSFSLVQDFLTVFPSMNFGIVMYALFHDTLKVCDRTLDFIGHYSWKITWISEKTLDFELQNIVETVTDYKDF